MQNENEGFIAGRQNQRRQSTWGSSEEIGSWKILSCWGRVGFCGHHKGSKANGPDAESRGRLRLSSGTPEEGLGNGQSYGSENGSVQGASREKRVLGSFVGSRFRPGTLIQGALSFICLL